MKIKIQIPRKVRNMLIFTILIFLAALIGQRFSFGYLHAADPFAMLAAYFLPLPLALPAALIPCLAVDLIKTPEWAVMIATVISKTLMILLVRLLRNKPAVQKAPDLYLAPVALIHIPVSYLACSVLLLTEGSGWNSFFLATTTMRKDMIQGFGGLLLFSLLFSGYKAYRKRKAEKETK